MPKGFTLDGYPAQVSLHAASDAQTVCQIWEAHRGELDLWEPFARLAEAIEETQKGAKAA